MATSRRGSSTELTAAGSTAIAQVNTDTTSYSLSAAVYKPVSTKNVEVVARFKPSRATAQNAPGSNRGQSSPPPLSSPCQHWRKAPPTGPKSMTYAIKPLSFDPKSIKGFSEKFLTSHYENNYSGAVKRLNALTEQLAGPDYAKAPVFVVNGLKREALIAANSMILHEIYFAASATKADRASGCRTDSRAISAASIAGAPSLSLWAKPKAAAPVGSSWPGAHATGTSSIAGRPITPPISPVGSRSSCSTCTNAPITWITAQGPGTTSRPI